jgi:hypothetical protein
MGTGNTLSGGGFEGTLTEMVQTVQQQFCINFNHEELLTCASASGPHFLQGFYCIGKRAEDKRPFLPPQ